MLMVQTIDTGKGVSGPPRAGVVTLFMRSGTAIKVQTANVDLLCLGVEKAVREDPPPIIMFTKSAGMYKENIYVRAADIEAFITTQEVRS